MSVTTIRHKAAVPFLYYEDLAAAVEWLQEAFGFAERMKLTTPEGLVIHAELELDGAAVMLGNLGPKNAGPPPDRVRAGVYVFVDDLDAHHREAVAAGVRVVQPPEDQPYGDRIYLAVDEEGHEWYFAQHLRDVSVEELSEMFSA